MSSIHWTRRAVLCVVLAAAASAPAWAQGTPPAETRGLRHVPAPVGPNGELQELCTGSHVLPVGVSRSDHPEAWSSLASITAAVVQLLAADVIRALDAAHPGL